MSGLFQRIGRRTADSPDGASVPESDTPTQQFTAQERSDADANVESDAPTTVIPAATAPTAPQPVPADDAALPAPRRPGFRERGRMRRRLRYLRRLRELQVRDLGGLVFDLRRFERKRDDLVTQKIDQMRACDDELQALELALEERRDLRDVHEPGIGGTCPRCFAIHSSTDHFCATCGVALGGAVQGPAQVAPVAPPSPPPAAVPVATPPTPDVPPAPPAAAGDPPQ